MNLSISPKKVLRYLLLVILFLVIFNILAIYLKLSKVDGIFKNIIYFFDVDHERNLPTFYSALALLAASFLLLIISVFHKNSRREHFQWKGLAFVFAFLSIDEMTVIHEQLFTPMQSLFNTTGLLYYAWFIPYVAILLVLLIIYTRWLFRLPKRVMILFIISGFTFVLGAIGFEAISGYYDELYGQDNFAYCASYTVEETLEMCGVAIFIYALLIYMSGKIERFNIKIA